MKSSSRQRRIRPLKAKATTADAAAEFDNYGAEPNMKLSHAFMVVLALHVVAVGGLFAFNKVKVGHSKSSEKLQTEVAAAQTTLPSEEVLPQSGQHSRESAVSASASSGQHLDNIATPVSSQKTKEQLPLASTKKIAAAPTPVEAPVVPTPTATKSAFLATKNASVSATGVAPAAVTALATMVSSKAVAAAPAPPAVAVEAVPATEYTIVKGDNPYKIARRFHISYDQLIKFNNISDPRKMQIGQKIRIPKKS